jgi:hypothetical protein
MPLSPDNRLCSHGQSASCLFQGPSPSCSVFPTLYILRSKDLLSQPTLTIIMPFFKKKGKTGNPWADTNESRRSSASTIRDSYDLRPTPITNPPVRHPPPPLFIPDPHASFRYDNGTGRLDPALIREQNLPPWVQTTDQLAEFIKAQQQEKEERSSTYSRQQSSRRPPTATSQHTRPPTAVSQHSQHSYVSGHTTLGRSDSGYSARSAHNASFRYNTRAQHVPAVPGIRSKYAVQPIARILPGTTRKHKYEGFWLARGTVRKTGSDKLARKQSIKSTHARQESKASTSYPPSAYRGPREAYRETSGWYDDSD